MDSIKSILGVELIITLICPILAVPILLYSIYMQRYEKLPLLALCMAIAAMAMPPFADLYRHTLQYINFTKINDDSWIHTNGKDYIFYTLSYLFAKSNIPFEFIRGLFTFFCYMVSFHLFKRTSKSSFFSELNKQESFLIFLCFFLSVPFIWIVNGIRLATAAYIAVISWIFFYDKKYLFGIIFLIISMLMHFSCILFIPVLLLTVRNIPINTYVFSLIMIIICISGTYVFNLIPTNYFIDYVSEESVDYYVNNSQDTFSQEISRNGMIAMFLERFPIIYILCYYLINHKIKSKESYLIKNIILLCCVFYPFLILFQKFCLMVIPLLIYLFVMDSNGISYNKIRNLALSCLIVFLAYLYGYREVFVEINIPTLLLPIFFTFFSFDTEEAMRKIY